MTSPRKSHPQTESRMLTTIFESRPGRGLENALAHRTCTPCSAIIKASDAVLSDCRDFVYERRRPRNSATTRRGGKCGGSLHHPQFPLWQRRPSLSAPAERTGWIRCCRCTIWLPHIPSTSSRMTSWTAGLIFMAARLMHRRPNEMQRLKSHLRAIAVRIDGQGAPFHAPCKTEPRDKGILDLLTPERLMQYKSEYWKRGQIDHEDVLYFAYRLLREFPALRDFLERPVSGFVHRRIPRHTPGAGRSRSMACRIRNGYRSHWRPGTSDLRVS